MNKAAMILAMVFLFPGGMVLARPGGGSGGGGFGGGDHGGGGGGWSGGGDRGGGDHGGNSGNTDNSNDGWHGGGHSGRSSSSSSSSGRTGSYHGNNNFRSGGAYNGRGYYGRNGGRYGTYNHFNHNYSYGTNANNYFHRFGSSSQGYHGRYSSNGGFHSNIVPQNLRRMGVTSVPRPLSNRALLSHNVTGSVPGVPHRGPGGRSFSGSVVSPSRMNGPAIRNQMTAIAGNRNFRAQVAANTSVAGRANHYYWHNWNGYNYCNYYDGYGNCWYGWDCGAGFFWTQYYADNWWWYDPWWGNWCWWSGGNWWYQDPATTTVYVYNNGNYAPAGSNDGYNDGSPSSNADDNGGSVYGGNTPQGQPPADEDYSQSGQSALGKENAPVDFLSRDGKVKVTVSAQGDAFLYNLKNPKASKPVYLDSNVDEVKFSNSGSGSEKILLIFKDGSFSTFNADGTPAEGAKT